MIKCVCIDAEDRPSKIPQHKWLEKGKEYTLAFSMTVLPQKKLAFQVQEIDLDDTITRKSKMGFGKYKEKTVQEMLDLRRTLDLISAYYKLTSINYQEDILTELKITEQYRIEKPSANKEMYYKFLNENGYKLRSRGQGADKLKKQTKALSKRQLQGMNHGR
jgi:hypothetical protein